MVHERHTTHLRAKLRLRWGVPQRAGRGGAVRSRLGRYLRLRRGRGRSNLRAQSITLEQRHASYCSVAARETEHDAPLLVETEVSLTPRFSGRVRCTKLKLIQT